MMKRLLHTGHTWQAWLVPALLILLYLPALGNAASGTHPDEAYYLGISAEMHATDAWLTPTLDGKPLWFKPPLLYWAQHIAYDLFGRTFFAGRLPVALAAVTLALLTGALARRMYGQPAGVWATLFAATTFGWLKLGRIAMMDAPLALAFTAAAYGSWRAAEEDRPAALLWTGVGAGAAFMLKGPVGALLVLLISGTFLALRRPLLLTSRWTIAAFGIGAAIGLPWYVASLLVHGRSFYQFFVVSQNLDRFLHPWTLHGEATLLVGGAVFLLPWTLLALGNLPPPSRWREPAFLLPIIWIAAVLLVFTLPSLKWPHYGLGCAPAVALLASRGLPPRWARISTGALLASIALTALLALRWPLPGAWRTTALLCAVAALLAVSAACVAQGKITAGGALCALAMALAVGIIIPSVNPAVIPAPALAQLTGRELRVYGNVPGLFTLTAGRPVRRVDGATEAAAEVELARALDQGSVIILSEGMRARLAPELRGRLTPLARWERLRSYLSPLQVIKSWRDRDWVSLFEPMWAMQRSDR